MTDANHSPDYLQPNQGIRRINRLPLVILGGLLLAMLVAISYTYQMRLAEMREREAQLGNKPAAASPDQVFKDAPDGGLIPAHRQEPTPPPVVVEQPPAAPDPDAEARERLRLLREQFAQQRRARAMEAAKAPTGIHITQGAPASSNETGSNAQAAAVQPKLGETGEEADINHAAKKAAWLNDRKPESLQAHYLPGGREMPLSRYEVKAGTVIPASMIGGINSDLPGQILAQVRENVFDTATGRYILIPQGAKLIGTYDNAVTTGQERVLVAWTRIIYPDGSSVDLGKMPGADAAGFAGLQDQVNTHFWKAFGSAILMSMVTAGIQISQGDTSSSTSGTSSQQTIAASLGQQMGQLGMEIARRNIQIQPTIEIRQGLHFTVMVTKDMVLKPWRVKKTAAQ